MIPRAVSRCSGASSSTSKIEQVHANFKSVARATSSRRSTFATSTKPVRASAAAAQVSIPTSAPAFPLPASFTGSRPSPLTVGALRSPRPFTVLPTPLPENASPIADPQYLASTVQAKLAIIDTCLFNHLDVPRAGRIFDQLRWDVLTPVPLSILNVDMHNRFLEAYFIMAEKEPEKGSYWVDRAWDLYDDMVQAKLAPPPDAETFGVALLAQMRLPDLCEQSGKAPTEVLRDIRSSSADTTIDDIVQATQSTEDDERKFTAFLREVSQDGAGLREITAELDTLLAKLSEPLPEANELPQVDPVMKKGIDETTGTEAWSVPYNIDHLRSTLRQIVEMKKDSDLESRQRTMEATVYQSAVQRFEHETRMLKDLEINTGIKKTTIQAWMWQWYSKLHERVKHDVKLLKKAEAAKEATETSTPLFGPGAKRAGSLAPFLACLSPNTLAMLTIMEIMGLQGAGGVTDGMKTARALMEVGRAVEAEYQSRLLRKHKVQRTGQRAGNIVLSTGGLSALIERRAQAALAEENVKTPAVLEWTADIRVKIGGILVNALLDVATVTRRTTLNGEEYVEEQPAFTHAYEYVRGNKLGVLKLNPAVAEQLAQDDPGGIVHPRQLPMLVPPAPWMGPSHGGYLTGRSQVMRIKESVEQTNYIRQAAMKGQLEDVFQSLDALGSTPWTINQELFEVVLKVWNSGKAYASIPPSSVNVEDPPKPADFDTNLKAKAEWETAMRQALTERRNNHSERCSTNYKMEIARAFIGEKIYFPHNLDFRGRAYPIPPHLSHIGDDLSRSLLKFAEAKPLGERGLRWLKIHVANLYGNDKISLDDREKFTMEHIEDVYDSAMNPLDGKQWWLKADDPWQCLATCMELRAALSSPDPLKFMSNLPVHQDGTCNGLQHYAALGGDAVGAAQVNLDVTDRPSDVYSFVANMVEQEIKKDMAAGMADVELLSGKVARKVVKQTVMTTVYGVTMVGARAQIERQLRDRGDIPREKTWALASYLARKTIYCIGDLFKGANGIQNWLSASAKIIARSIPPARVEECLKEPLKDSKKKVAAKAIPPPEEEGEVIVDPEVEVEAEADAGDPNAGPVKKVPAKGPFAKRVQKEQMTSVIWTTALGLPIVQPYRKVKRSQVLTNLQTVFISDPGHTAEVSPAKQASAFPPNFIHSLDATHMMLTALEMSNAKMAFASVHDSYWTHACSIDDMSRIIRDTFVELHSRPILENLHKEFVERYRGHMVPAMNLSSEDVELIFAREDVTPEQKLQFAKASRKHKAKIAALEEAASQDPSALIAPVSSKVKVKKAPKTKEERTEDAAANRRFVPIEWLLPPLPKRGDFDVSRTKNSLYFFS